VDHPALQGTRLDDADLRHQVAERPGLVGREELLLGARLHLKAADGVGGAQQVIGRRVVGRQPVEVERDTLVLPDQRRGFARQVERLAGVQPGGLPGMPAQVVPERRECERLGQRILTPLCEQFVRQQCHAAVDHRDV
jgi:hypothetical protein